jgi:spore cortex formation protein SpoVR/YcgB (stage V sporulation)
MFSIAIAAAVTAYARIHMSQFKNNPDFKLFCFFSNTDSVYFYKPKPKHLVNSKNLGKMKMENIIDKGIFLAPKMYYLENKDGKVIYKVKGLSHDIELTRNDFENLLFKQSTLQRLKTK